MDMMSSFSLLTGPQVLKQPSTDGRGRSFRLQKAEDDEKRVCVIDQLQVWRRKHTETPGMLGNDAGNNTFVMKSVHKWDMREIRYCKVKNNSLTDYNYFAHSGSTLYCLLLWWFRFAKTLVNLYCCETAVEAAELRCKHAAKAVKLINQEGKMEIEELI